jgi:formate-dependent nitrite reductase membrane component NrfD
MNPERANEDRLDALREEAARTGRIQSPGVVPSDSVLPRPSAAEDYHGLPVLKPPTWTWQVPLYFFAGGVGGAAAVIAFLAHLLGKNPDLIRPALWVGLAGALASPPLLIADLGRPSRFLNMLRVFKWRSPMSVGAWTLMLFSSAAFLAVACFELNQAGYGDPLISILGWAAQAGAAVSGLVLLSYTSVLLGVSAIPVWSENRTLLPPQFVASALGAAAAVLELVGVLIPATQFMGIAASAVETLIGVVIEVQKRDVDQPLREGRVGWAFRAGEVLAGPVSLLLRIGFGRVLVIRQLAAVCFIVGALIIRFAWIAAGRVSSHNPQALFRIQQRRGPDVEAMPAETPVVITERAG